MPAYKYSSNTSYNPFIQASVKPKMGKNYAYNGRLYCQVKNAEKFSYADLLYNLNVRLVSWTVNSIDVELEIKNIEIRDEHDLAVGQCNKIINSVSVLEGIPIYIRISNTGHILKVFNISDLASIYSAKIIQESHIIECLEANPLISAFLCGQIEQGTKTEKVFVSNIFPSIKINSELKVESKKERFNNATETNIANKRILFDREKLESLATEALGCKMNKDNVYDFKTLVTFRKGVDRVLAFSMISSTEEVLGVDENVYISVGMEKIVLEKDVDLPTKLYSFLLKNISAIF